MTPLLGPENSDLGPRYGGALEAYVPCVLGGRVVGACEVYVDLAAIRPIRAIVWSSTAVVFGVPLLAMLILQRGRAARPVPAGARPLAPVAPATGAVRPMAADDAGAEGSLDGPLDADAPTGMVGAQAPTERWLSRHEAEVLHLLATHRTYPQIASELLLSEETVRSHVKHVLRKLNEPDRSHAVTSAVRAGILPG